MPWYPGGGLDDPRPARDKKPPMVLNMFPHSSREERHHHRPKYAHHYNDRQVSKETGRQFGDGGGNGNGGNSNSNNNNNRGNMWAENLSYTSIW